MTKEQRDRAANIFCATYGCYHYSYGPYTHCEKCVHGDPIEMTTEDKKLKKQLDTEAEQEMMFL